MIESITSGYELFFDTVYDCKVQKQNMENIGCGRVLKLLDIPDTGSRNLKFEETIVGLAEKVGPEI